MRSRLCFIAVVVGAALLFGLRLGERSLWSEEVRWAQIPREMLVSGDWLHPTINGRTYYDKPLGSYWLVLAATLMRGQGDVDELAARLPSAIAALLGVIFLIAIARRLYDSATAVFAGMILATMFAYVVFARTAAADAENVAGILAALWIYVRFRDRPPGAWLVALWVVMALTSLTKGLLGFALPVLVIGLDRLFDPAVPGPMFSIRRTLDSQRWLLTPWSLLAIPLAALVYLGPFLLSIRDTGTNDGLDMVVRENIKRFFDPVNHRGEPVWYYLYVIFALAAPWSVLLPAALWQHLRKTTASLDERRADRFAILFFAAIFLFFTAAASRRSYYLLPVLPAAALIIARMLATALISPLPRFGGEGSGVRGPAPESGTAVLARHLDPLTPALSPEAGERGSSVLRLGTRILMGAGWIVLAIPVIGAGAALWPDLSYLPEPWNRLPPLPLPRWYAAAWLISLAALGIGFARIPTGRIACPLAVIAGVALGYVFLAGLPAIERYRTQRSFSAEVRRLVGDDWPHVAYYRNRELVYYLAAPGPIEEFEGPEPLKEALRAERIRFVLARRRDAKQISDAATEVAGESSQLWETEIQRGEKLVLMEGARPR